MTYAGFKKSGTVVRKAISVGSFVEIVAVIPGILGVPDRTVRLGVIKESHIIFETRMYKHKNTKNNKLIDQIIPSASVVEFRGILEEVNRENILLLLNRDPDEEKIGNG